MICRTGIPSWPLGRALPIGPLVNAGEKMYQRAGVKLHHGEMPTAPTGRLLRRDKQNEKRIAFPANVPERRALPHQACSLTQSILRPAPAPLLNPKSNAY